MAAAATWLGRPTASGEVTSVANDEVNDAADMRPEDFESSEWDSARMSAHSLNVQPGEWQVFHEGEPMPSPAEASRGHGANGPVASWRAGYRWAVNQMSVDADGWSSCAPACGQSFRTRVVVCIRGDGTIVDDSFCSGKAKPEEVEVCRNYSLCTPCWDVGAWGPCDAACGESERKREVTCRFCEDVSVRPSAVQAPLFAINYREFHADGEGRSLPTDADYCRYGKVGICDAVDWTQVDRKTTQKPMDGLVDLPPQIVELGYDCNVLGNPVPVGGELWEPGAALSNAHPSYPDVEYVFLGPFATEWPEDAMPVSIGRECMEDDTRCTSTGEPLDADVCVNYCLCEPHCWYDEWEDRPYKLSWLSPTKKGAKKRGRRKRARRMQKQKGCVREEVSGQLVRRSPFDLYSPNIKKVKRNACSFGLLRRAHRTCWQVEGGVGVCESDPTRRCVTSGPLHDESRDFTEHSQMLPKGTTCGLVERYTFRSAVSDAPVRVLERDRCVERDDTVWDCESKPAVERRWPAASQKPVAGAGTRLFKGIDEFQESGDMCPGQQGKGIISKIDCPGETVQVVGELADDSGDTCKEIFYSGCRDGSTTDLAIAGTRLAEATADVAQLAQQADDGQVCTWVCDAWSNNDAVCEQPYLTAQAASDANFPLTITAGTDTYADECAADCGFMASQCRHCWCACSGPSNPQAGQEDEWLYDIRPQNATASGSNAVCANMTMPETTQMCSNDQFCECMFKVEPFPACHGCGYNLQERSVTPVQEVGFETARCTLQAQGVRAASSAGLDWELIMQLGDDDLFKYDSPYWENGLLLNVMDPVAHNRKLPAFLSKKFDRIRMCFGYGFSMDNPDFEDDDVMPASQQFATPSGWQKDGNDVLLVSADNPSYNNMEAASGSQFAVLMPGTAITTSVRGLTRSMLVRVSFAAASKDLGKLAAIQASVNSELRFSEPEAGYGGFYEYSFEFTPGESVVQLSIGNEGDEGALLLDHVTVSSEGWTMVAQELGGDGGQLLRFLGREFGDDAEGDGKLLVDRQFGGNSANLGPRLAFPDDYNEVLVTYGDTWYQFAPTADVFADTVALSMPVQELTSNDGDLMSWVNENGGAVLCRAASAANASLPGQTSWGILPADDFNRGCGCDSAAWVGHGAYYAGSATNCTACSCYDGGWMGARDTGAAHAWTASEWADEASAAETLQVFVRTAELHSGDDDESSQNCIEYTFDRVLASALDLFRGGEVVVGESSAAQTAFRKADFDRVFGATDCAMARPGFNVVGPDGTRARWGYLNNKPSDDCVDAATDDYDGAAGIGLTGEEDSNGVSAGHTAYFLSDEASEDTKLFRRAWLWVADSTQAAPVEGFTALDGADWNSAADTILQGDANVVPSAEACKALCAERDDCAVGKWLSGSARFGECWLSSAKANVSSTEWCGADDTQLCESFEKSQTWLLRAVQTDDGDAGAAGNQGYLHSNHLVIPGGEEWELNQFFPTGTKFKLTLPEFDASGAAFCDESQPSILGELSVSHLVSKRFSFGLQSYVYWNEDIEFDGTIYQAGRAMVWDAESGVYKVCDDANPCQKKDHLSGVCIWTAQAETGLPFVRWPGEIVQCNKPGEKLRYMSQPTCMDTCLKDPLCQGYTVWLEGTGPMDRRNMITNPDFESTPWGQYTAQTVPPGFAWEMGTAGGDVDVMTRNEELVVDMGPLGDNAIDLNGDGPGEISQVLMTQVGQLYILSFRASGNFNCEPALKSMEVVWSPGEDADSEVAAKLRVNTQGLSSEDMAWKLYSYELRATHDVSTLTFRSTNDGCGGMMIDDVRLVRSAPIGAECARLGIDMEVELVDDQVVQSTFTAADTTLVDKYMGTPLACTDADPDGCPWAYPFTLEYSDAAEGPFAVAWGGMSPMLSDLPDELLGCGGSPNAPETTDPTGAFSTADLASDEDGTSSLRTWFKGVTQGGLRTLYTFRLRFASKARILNIKVGGVNFGGSQFKLLDAARHVLSQVTFNSDVPGADDLSEVSSSDMRHIDCERCAACTVLVPGSTHVTSEVFYLSETNDEAAGRMRDTICVRTPSCYHHSESGLHSMTPWGSEVCPTVGSAGEGIMCTDGLQQHIDPFSDAYEAVVKEDRCVRLSTRADEMLHGLPMRIGHNRAVVFTVSAGTAQGGGVGSDFTGGEGVIVGLFTSLQPRLQSAAVGRGMQSTTGVPSYVVTLGSHDNMKSSIRRGVAAAALAEEDTPALLSSDPRTFWVDTHFSGSGVNVAAADFFVRVGKGSTPGGDVFLQWQDTDPLPVSHVGVSSGEGSASWSVCTDGVVGQPHEVESCFSTECPCEWSMADCDLEEQECSETCGDGVKSCDVGCVIASCGSDVPDALCSLRGRQCPQTRPVTNEKCHIALYEKYPYGYGESGDEHNFGNSPDEDGFELVYGSNCPSSCQQQFKLDELNPAETEEMENESDHGCRTDLPPDAKNKIRAIAITGEGCGVLLYDSDGQQGSFAAFRVPDGESHWVWTAGTTVAGEPMSDIDPPENDGTRGGDAAQIAGRANSIEVMLLSDFYCDAATRPVTQITCSSSEGCCYWSPRCPYGDCGATECTTDADVCKGVADSGGNGERCRDVYCEQAKFHCNRWVSALPSWGEYDLDDNGSVCAEPEFVASLTLVDLALCYAELTPAQEAAGCPYQDAKHGAAQPSYSELLECFDGSEEAAGQPEITCAPSSYQSELANGAGGAVGEKLEMPQCENACEEGDDDCPKVSVQECQSCQNEMMFTCEWDKTVSWQPHNGRCDGCGDVIQHRKPRCLRCDGNEVDCPSSVLDTYGKCCYAPLFHSDCGGCDKQSMPATTKHCVAFNACSYEWHIRSEPTKDMPCQTFTMCVPMEEYSVDPRSEGSPTEQKEWCTSGPERFQSSDSFVTYGLGACWAGDSGVQTTATRGWDTPCDCYYGAAAATIGHHYLGTLRVGPSREGLTEAAAGDQAALDELETICDDDGCLCQKNTKYAQKYSVTSAGYVSFMAVHLGGGVQGGADGVSDVKGALYTDGGGNPNIRIAVTETGTARGTPGWVTLVFKQAQEGGSGVYLTGGSYWLSFVLKMPTACWGYEGSARVAAPQYVHNAELWGQGTLLHPSDPFGSARDSTARGFSMYAAFQPDPDVSTTRSTRGPCPDSSESCAKCLDTVDNRDEWSDSECVWVAYDAKEAGGILCQPRKWVERMGVELDRTCQESWGTHMYAKLGGWACGGRPREGPTGELAQRLSTEEECAQTCYLAAKWWQRWEDTGKVSLGAQGFDCAAYEYDASLRTCRLFGTDIDPAPAAGGDADCRVLRDLPDMCRFTVGDWVRGGDSVVYYVHDAASSIYSAAAGTQCAGEDIWGGAPLPTLACDGMADSTCALCVEGLQAHNKLVGEFSCDIYQKSTERICQFERAEVSCGEGLAIKVSSATYGRQDDAYCADIGADNEQAAELLATGSCGFAGNVAGAVQDLCDGKSQCDIAASDDEFGDQGCPEIFKYLEVAYECMLAGGDPSAVVA